MKKEGKIMVSITAMISGFVLNGLAWTVLPGPTMSTLGLLIGLGLLFGGFIFLMITLSKR